MDRLIRNGSRIALSLVLVCGLSPQIALADTPDDEEVEQVQGSKTEGDSPDGAEKVEEGSNDLDNGVLGGSSESNGAVGEFDPEQSGSRGGAESEEETHE